jgi:aryl-alcohol dehydrogenase-like predicted oxidoreductase
VIATKFGHRYASRFQREQLWSVEDVRRQLEDSLSALGVDSIDLYQFHSGTKDAFENDDLWSMLEAQKKAGKLRSIGISIGNSIPREEQERQAGRAKEVGAECLQVVYNRMQRLPENVIFPICARENLGVLARVPLASGYLSGKYREGAVFGPEDFRSTKTREELNRMAAEAERIRKEEVPPGVSMSAWALAWCLQNPAVTAVIPGCKSPQQVAQNAAAADLVPAEKG